LVNKLRKAINEILHRRVLADTIKLAQQKFMLITIKVVTQSTTEKRATAYF
jgi:hypothetical protein